jgi:hypothetical protein
MTIFIAITPSKWPAVSRPAQSSPRASERQPETLAQAHSWQKAKRSYLLAGLCERCAAQAAWAHQCGWLTLTELPCPACAGIVAALPVATPNAAWRRFPNGRPKNEEIADFRAAFATSERREPALHAAGVEGSLDREPALQGAS